MKLTTLVPTLVAVFCLLGCNQLSQTPAPDKDITKTALPDFVGTFTAPKAKLRVYEDGRFLLETTGEDTRWGAGSTEVHYASCSFKRHGTLRVLEREGKKLLRFDVSDRTVTGAKQDSRSKGETPKPICLKASDLFSVASTIELWISAEGTGQFLLSSDYTPQPYYLHLESGARQEVYADGTFYGELSLLFVPKGKTVSVTDLLQPALSATYRSWSTDDVLELDAELHSLHYASPSCKFEEKLDYEVLSTGEKIYLTAPKDPVATPAESAGSDLCSAQHHLLAARNGQHLFDITDLSSINGLGALDGISFHKVYPSDAK